MMLINSVYNAHVENLYKMLYILKLTDAFRNNLLRMFYKFNDNQLPHYLMTMISDAEKLHAYNTRSNPVLETQYQNLYAREKSVIYHIPLLINDTDKNVTKLIIHIMDSAPMRECFCSILPIGKPLVELLYMSRQRH